MAWGTLKLLTTENDTFFAQTYERKSHALCCICTAYWDQSKTASRIAVSSSEWADKFAPISHARLTHILLLGGNS
jgi:hypothetical protein